MIYIIYVMIILVTIILYFLVKDKKRFLRKIGITTIISGLITLVLGFILNISLNNFLNNFNVAKISSLIFSKFVYNSIILLVLGGIELIFSKLINKNKIEVLSRNNSNQKFDN